MAYQLQEINKRIQTDVTEFLAECDQNYADRVSLAADKILANLEQSPIVLLSGPSGSGKTTTALKIAEELQRRGVNSHAVAMDPENVTVHTLALKKGSTLMERRDLMPSGEEVAKMLDFSLTALRGQGYEPYYLYRQKYMSGSLENVGWAKPGTDSLYNIVMMEELHTVLSVGGGGVTKLVDPAAGKIVRLPNPKYPHDYLAALDKVLAQKEEILSFYQK